MAISRRSNLRQKQDSWQRFGFVCSRQPTVTDGCLVIFFSFLFAARLWALAPKLSLVIFFSFIFIARLWALAPSHILGA
ncbi:hypothetical protein CISIN_1g0349352mg [Citrus sinensis]|uniref:Uncharacterized protein n=1 Tax=Citrus sinensis TaxID=2711 RepID=A0A067DKE2_CITSI|nr:hypothetical protein CISIN_1g0349352mg [Citrus sinensis]